MIFQPIFLPSIRSRPVIHCLFDKTSIPEQFFDSYEVVEESVSVPFSENSKASLLCISLGEVSTDVTRWIIDSLPTDVPTLLASESFEVVESYINFSIDDFYIGPFSSFLFYQRINALIRDNWQKDSHLNLSFLAYYDSLTGALSRARVENEIESRCMSNSYFSILYIDLDDFKNINDFMGHDVGDEVLRQVAFRLKQSLKKKDLLARIGGDEFCVLIEGKYSLQELKLIAYRLISVISSPYHFKHHVASISASIGVVSCPDDARTLFDLMSTADQMMYESKKLGKGQVKLFKDNDCFLTKKTKTI